MTQRQPLKVLNKYTYLVYTRFLVYIDIKFRLFYAGERLTIFLPLTSSTLFCPNKVSNFAKGKGLFSDSPSIVIGLNNLKILTKVAGNLSEILQENFSFLPLAFLQNKKCRQFNLSVQQCRKMNIVASKTLSLFIIEQIKRIQKPICFKAASSLRHWY